MTALRNNVPVLLILAVILGLNVLFQRYMDPYVYKVLVDVGITITLAVSLNLINGITGQFSLGHAGFMAIGAYVAASLTMFVFNPWTGGESGPLVNGLLLGVVVVAGGLCAAVAGLIVGIPTLRLRGDYLAIATLGFGEIIRIIIQNMEKVGGPRGMNGIPSHSNFFWVFAWAVLCITVVHRLAHAVKGRAFFAIREDEVAASAVGIDVTKYKVIAFILGSFFAGVAGGLFAHSSTGLISPSQFDAVKSIELVVIVVLGGLGSISGAVIAAIVLTVLPEALRDFAEYRMVVYSLLLIMVMLTRPQGLMGMREIPLPWLRKPASRS
jgi:branched-chain amino acid transport system permease protein